MRKTTCMMVQLFAGIILLLATPGHAYLSILDSGEPVAKGRIHAGLAPQIFVGETQGGEGIFWLKTGLDDGRDLSIQAGFGEIDFWTQLATRWIPIPDYEGQPAIGLRFDVTLARDESYSHGVLRVAPFLSKRFRSETGHIEPYVYLPLGLRIQEGTYTSLSQFIVGSQMALEDLRPIYFYVEVGANLRQAPAYFTVGIASQFSSP